MGLETGTYIDALVPTNPASTDGLAQADDHIRLLKGTLQNTFPNISGAVGATQVELNVLDGITASTAELNVLTGITATTAELNFTDGVTSNIQTQLNTLISSAIPAGIISMWSGASNAIPTGYALCDGSNSTPDLRNRFVIGAGSTYAVGSTGGSADAINVSHTHTASITDSGHNHQMFETYLASSSSSRNSDLTNSSSVAKYTTGGTDYAYCTRAGTGTADVGATSTSTTGISVSNSTEGSSATDANLPPYYALCYIMKT